MCIIVVSLGVVLFVSPAMEGSEGWPAGATKKVILKENIYYAKEFEYLGSMINPTSSIKFIDIGTETKITLIQPKNLIVEDRPIDLPIDVDEQVESISLEKKVKELGERIVKLEMKVIILQAQIIELKFGR